MAKPSFKIGLDKFFSKIEATYTASTNQQSLRTLAQEAIRLITVRTRLGYGVMTDEGSRFRLKRLSDGYVDQRKKAFLSSSTSAGKSNLTRTGQMLDSMRVISVRKKSVSFGPQGRRFDGNNNAVIARYVSEVRPFLHLSKTEYPQLIRFYRRMFGDLAKSKRLTFNQKL